MSTTWVVKFCEGCFCAFDVEKKSKRTPDLCESCRSERRRARNRRCYQRSRRPARRT